MDADAASIVPWREKFTDATLQKFGALYFPWVTGVFDGPARSGPPCGFVAGQMATSDALYGVGKAPANDVMKSAVSLSVMVDAELQRQLNPMGINCIRKFDDGEVRLFGARTLSDDPRFQYVHARRLLFAVTKRLRRDLLWAVFEPNGTALQRRVLATVTSQLSALVAKGVVAGTRAEDAFYVKCNETTNPPEAMASGQLVAEIGLAVSAPAEFIVLSARRSPDALSLVVEDV
jgi:phage tail sheath protein FI